MRKSVAISLWISLCILALFWFGLPAVSIALSDAEDGSWQPSVVDDCRQAHQDRVCLDWVSRIGGVTRRPFSCCLTNNDIGSTDLSICTEFRHNH